MNPDCCYCGYEKGASQDHPCTKEAIKNFVNTVLYENIRRLNSSKGNAILQAIRECETGNDVIINNDDGSVYCILTVKCKEHPESL